MSPNTRYMRLALNLARKGYGSTSPNPMVGAVLVKAGRIIGRGWHHRAGEPHAEIEALRDAQRRKHKTRGATLFVTLEPCCTYGRTPPCTEAIIAAGIKRVVVGATDPNPRHAGRAFGLLRHTGIEVVPGVLAEECSRLNEAFHHWIVSRTPFVTVKAAMTLDGKIATADGQSKWITGEAARQYGMHLRLGSDAILVGIRTLLADDPSLTVRLDSPPVAEMPPRLRRIVLDSAARAPLTAKVISDGLAHLTTIVVSAAAPKKRVAALAKRVRVLVSPLSDSQPSTLNLPWLLKTLGEENVTSLLVEGGGEVNASFLLGGLAHRIAFFYAPKVLGGCAARRGVAGDGARSLDEAPALSEVEWRQLGADWLLRARIAAPSKTTIVR